MGRDWRVDTLRGYFLVTMTLGHFPNTLAPFTEYTFGYASSPDGFVFLSGLVSTWVYLSIRDRRGPAEMVSRVLRRVGTIYFAHMALVVIGILTAIQSGGAGARMGQALRTFVSAALLSNQEGFDRILPMYCIFLALTPIVLKQFTDGRAWMIGVISGAFWVAAQFGLGDARVGAATVAERQFNVFAWQALFVAGQYFGYRALRTGHSVVKSRALIVACSVVALLLMVDRHLALWGRGPLLHFSGHPDHNPARFLDAACLGYLVWLVPRTVDIAAMKLGFFRFLNFLGKHSLQVFAFSMLITRFEAHTIAGFGLGPKLMITVMTVLSLALPAWLHTLWQERSSGRTPVAASVVAPVLPAA